jgi:hypothetical protein
MVNATVDNDPVSIQLSPGQETTVPSNETWKVQMTFTNVDGSNRTSGAVYINGVPAIGYTGFGESPGPIASNTVLVGNDTVKLVGGKGASITGFVVDS